jgi:hypothetical protein
MKLLDAAGCRLISLIVIIVTFLHGTDLKRMECEVGALVSRRNKMAAAGGGARLAAAVGPPFSDKLRQTVESS